MKPLFFFIFIFLHLLESQAQTVIQVGDRKMIATTVDSSTFSIYGKWRIIHRDYVAETPHSFELLPLELLNIEAFNWSKTQGKTCYGNIVSFSDSLFYPYAPYMPRLIVKPTYKKKYPTIGAGKYDNEFLYVRRFQNQPYLTIQVYCDLKYEEDFTVIVLNRDYIALVSSNIYIYMKRHHTKANWRLDAAGNFVQELMGFNYFDFYIPQIYKDKKYKLSLTFELVDRKGFNYFAAIDASDNKCARKNAKTIFSIEKSNSLSVKIALDQLASNIIEIGGSFKSQLNRWRVKWKFTPN